MSATTKVPKTESQLLPGSLHSASSSFCALMYSTAQARHMYTNPAI